MMQTRAMQSSYRPPQTTVAGWFMIYYKNPQCT